MTERLIIYNFDDLDSLDKELIQDFIGGITNNFDVIRNEHDL